MTWFVRLMDGPNGESGKDPPYYEASSDKFTLKLFHGGDLNGSCSAYIGGKCDYVDNCNIDEMSFIELTSMCKEVGVTGVLSLYYKFPEAQTTAELWPLDTDDDVLEMCALIPAERLIYVYCVSKDIRHIDISLSENPITTQPYFDLSNDLVAMAEFEKIQKLHVYEMEGIYKDFSDLEDIEDNEYEENPILGDNDKGEGEEILLDDLVNERDEAEHSDASRRSFHGDSSNIDSTDEDVCTQKKQMELVRTTNGDPKIAVVEDNMCGEENCLSSESSVYADSEDEKMAANSTDDEESGFTVFNEKTDMGDPKFELGMMFGSIKIFKEAVKKHSILHMRPIVQIKNYGVRARFECEKGCPWKIYASKMNHSSTIQIKIYNGNHRCSPTFEQKQINSKWVAEYYEDDIRMNPTWPLLAFQQKVVNEWNCDISIWAIGRAKKKALENINGKHADQYGAVYQYRNELMKVMPQSTIEIVTESVPDSSNRQFLRMYICFGPVKKGFMDGCRPLVGLDGCHLKGPYGGQLLAAVGVDANDGMYPVAWAIVEAENNESWKWFLELVRSDLLIINEGGWTFVSDRRGYKLIYYRRWVS